jgi:hypothetical protein
MGSKKNKMATTLAPKLKGGKAKECPHIADALSKPLGEPTEPADKKPTDKGSAAPADGDTKAKAKAKVTAKEAMPKKMGALDAAARVLEEEGKALNCQDLIEKMASKGYWSSPKGLTPAATLSAAILRELKVKGGESRFKKTERGHFAFAR